MRGELRAEREKNARLAEKLERVEAQIAVSGARKAKSLLEPANANVPELSVVKLKPRTNPAPKIDTRVSVVEPSEEGLDAVEADESGNKNDGPALVFTDEDSGSSPADQEELVVAEFDAAMNAMKVGNIDGGVLRLQTFAAAHGRHPKADNALYFAGVGMMGLEKFDGAARAFAQVVDNYPAGDATVDSMLKLAECRVRLNQTADAQALYARVVESYPGTPAANAAQSRLAALPRVPKEAP